MNDIEFGLEVKKRVKEHCQIMGVCSNCNLWAFGCQGERYYSDKLRKEKGKNESN